MVVVPSLRDSEPPDDPIPASWEKDGADSGIPGDSPAEQPRLRYVAGLFRETGSRPAVDQGGFVQSWNAR